MTALQTIFELPACTLLTDRPAFPADLSRALGCQENVVNEWWKVGNFVTVRASRYGGRGGYERDSGDNDYLFHGSVSGLNLKSVVALLRRRWESRFIPLRYKYF
ncbi:MAG TPA: hypothetical protein EYQ20_20795 [candidate division Zixibacteria bacterium]|nr:hypothetical protein [candidate division Zixibacteria bacterium]